MVRILLSTRLGERKWTQADLSRMTGIRPIRSVSFIMRSQLE